MTTIFPEPGSLSSDNSNTSRTFQIFNPSGTSLPFHEEAVDSIFREVEHGENVGFSSVEIVFTGEDDIVEINKTYLDRDYITDIISFRYDENENSDIEGTLYCCAPRIYEQSQEFGSDAKSEFLRIIIHGLLHLAGYDDQFPNEKEKMTELEDHYLQKISSV